MKTKKLPKIALMLVLLSAVLASGCTEEKTQSNAEELCIKLCEEKLNKGADLSRGPCLSNEITEEWVCDVAHSPRKEIDNQPKNQCKAYQNGTAKHFVEVDTNCNLIKKH